MAELKRLAIVTTHPIQYNAPLFRLLASRGHCHPRVFYTWGQASGKLFDRGFGRELEWDIPLQEGYELAFLENRSADPGCHHFRGIVNPTILREIDKFDPDALLVYGWNYASHLGVLRHYHGRKRILFRGDSTLLDETSGLSVKKLGRRLFLRWIYRHVDMALYVGANNKEYFLRHGLAEGQLRWAPHAIDNRRFADDAGQYTREAHQWRQELGIPSTAVVFLFAGKLEPKKDPLLLIRSFLELNAPNAWLILVGNGILETECRQAAGGHPRIFFLEFQNQRRMPVVYRLGDVFVLPSQGPGETWGLAVNEAMACGRAVLVSDRCGCAVDLVTDRENGFTFGAGRSGELLAKMKFLLENSGGIRKMGEAAAALIQKWSFDEIARVVEQEIRP